MESIARPSRFALLALVLATTAGGCKKKEAQAAAIESVPVSRQDIVVDVEATGVLSPINAVEVRSKASGQIVSMPVQTGTEVKPGDLLVRIDPRDAQTRYNQAAAQLRAARTQLEVTRSQYDRARTLSQQGVITAPELESATTAYANAQSQVANAQTAVEQSRIALEDVTIRAPSAGVVIARNVAPGQVIASATNSPSGGTVLLTLADLDAVYDSVLVSESDIGKVRPGQQVSVTVDAYPNRIFRGVVEKIEPRATVQQSVTMFPVLVRLDNTERLLMPGMNSDVTVLVQREQQALTVPNDALATPRDAGTAATALGLDAEEVRSVLAGAGGRGGAPGGDTGLTRTVTSSGGTTGTPNGDASAGGTRARGDSSRAGRMAGGQSGQGGNGGAGGNGGWRGRQGGGMGGGMGGGRAGGGRAQRGVVFVRKGESYEPRLVTLGIGNYDVTQVLSGVQEGEQVAIISSAVLQQTRTERNERMRSRTQLPGMGGSSTGAGGGRGGAGGPGGGGPGGGGGGGGAPRGPGGGGR